MVVLARRRWLFLVVNLATWVVLCAGVARLCAAGGWTIVDVAILLAFAAASPWSVVGFWNALIGFWLLHVARPSPTWTSPFAATTPSLPRCSTAVVMTLRNEDPARAFRRLRATKTSLDGTGHGGAFDWFVLSDTDVPGVAAAEEAAFGAWRRDNGGAARRLHYRRRTDNSGYKAGNIFDFCERCGGAYEFMLLLDADSLMAGETILDLVLVAEANPKLGIAQTLAIGLPAASTFARLFQFGMRHGLRTYMAGAAWWSADCGSFWGHNALVRIAPLVAHCRPPPLPGPPPWGGPIMAHDQVEAALMRRAGYEVRVFPDEAGSYEDAPPDLLEFTLRDLRWCQGNLQYWPLLAVPGLPPTSRFQLFWAAMMFYGMPAANILLALVAVRQFSPWPPGAYPARLAMIVYGSVFLMGLMPKLAGYLGTAITRGAIARYGGARRFTIGCLLELLASFMTKAITEWRVSVFMAALPFGARIGWSGQQRDAGGVTWSAAADALWPATLFGVLVVAAFAARAPILLAWSLPLTAGLVLAMPFTVITGHPAVGDWLRCAAICATLEERAPPPVVAALAALMREGNGAPSAAAPPDAAKSIPRPSR